MSKITLTNLATLQNSSIIGAVNANNAVLTTAMDNTLSRDGTSPNTMGANLDMNNHQIINLPAPSTANSPVRLTDVGNVILVNTIYTIATLPTGITTGTRVFVSNGVASPSLAAIVSTTGSTTVPVYYDGTNWRYG